MEQQLQCVCVNVCMCVPTVTPWCFIKCFVTDKHLPSYMSITVLLRVCSSIGLFKVYGFIFYILFTTYIFYILLCPYCTISPEHAHVDINMYYVLALWPLTVKSTSSANYLLDSVHTIHTCNTLDASAHVPHYTLYVAKTIL